MNSSARISVYPCSPDLRQPASEGIHKRSGFPCPSQSIFVFQIPIFEFLSLFSARLKTGVPALQYLSVHEKFHDALCQRRTFIKKSIVLYSPIPRDI